VTALAKELGLDKAPTHHRVGKAIKAGYLVNQQDRRGKPAQIVLGDPLPEDKELLPLPAMVEAAGEYAPGVADEGEYTSSVITPPEMTATLQQLYEKPSPDKGIGTVAQGSTAPPMPDGLQHPLTSCPDSKISTTVAVLQAEQEGSTNRGIHTPAAEQGMVPPVAQKPQPQPVGARPAINGKGEPGRFIDAQGKPTDDPELGYYGRVARAPLDATYQATTEKQPDAVADVPDPTPPAADVIDEAEKVKQEADQPVSTPDPVPATESSDLPPRPPGMLDGDYRRWLGKIRNQKAVQQFDAAMKERLLH
jgi:hypothetical protein